MSEAKRIEFPRAFLMPDAAMSTGPGAITVLPGAGHSFDCGGLGVRWKIDGRLTDQLFAVVHHFLAPHALAAPLHYHRKEDEMSYVLTGKLGALLGEEVVIAHPGT
jgi:quercetin dioxygenase-like cupin family protein